MKRVIKRTQSSVQKLPKNFPLGGKPVLTPLGITSRSHLMISTTKQNLPLMGKSVVGWSLDVRHAMLVEKGKDQWVTINAECVDDENRLKLAQANNHVALPAEYNNDQRTRTNVSSVLLPASAVHQRRLAEYLHSVLSETMAKLSPDAIKAAVGE